MKNKKHRLQLILELIKNESIGSQNELAEKLEEHGVVVTQATLSRDLKALRVSKVAADHGGYIYVTHDADALRDTMLRHNHLDVDRRAAGFQSAEFSGNLAVLKTRNGYASGLAYDIDMSQCPEILGTIAGSDTVFAILRDGISHEQARQVLQRFAHSKE